MDASNPIAAIIASKFKTGAKPGGKGPATDPLRIAAEDLISAVKDGDVDGVMSALQAAVECGSMPMSDEAEEPPGGEE